MSPGQALGLGASGGESSSGVVVPGGRKSRVAQQRPSSPLGAGESRDRDLGPGAPLRDSTGVLFVCECESWLLAPALCMGLGGQARPWDSACRARPGEPSLFAFPVPGGFWRASMAQGRWRNDQFSLLFPNYSADSVVTLEDVYTSHFLQVSLPGTDVGRTGATAEPGA